MAIPLYAPDARQRQRRPVTLRLAARLRRHQQRLADRLTLLRRRPGQFRAHLRQRVLDDVAVPLPVLAGELALLDGMHGVPGLRAKQDVGFAHSPARTRLRTWVSLLTPPDLPAPPGLPPFPGG